MYAPSIKTGGSGHCVTTIPLNSIKRVWFDNWDQKETMPVRTCFSKLLPPGQVKWQHPWRPADFWNTELILEKPEPPENSSIELVPFETGSDSTKNAEWAFRLRPENKSLISNLLKQAWTCSTYTSISQGPLITDGRNSNEMLFLPMGLW